MKSTYLQFSFPRHKLKETPIVHKKRLHMVTICRASQTNDTQNVYLSLESQACRITKMMQSTGEVLGNKKVQLFAIYFSLDKLPTTTQTIIYIKDCYA